jgi:hypothetical protein
VCDQLISSKLSWSFFRDIIIDLEVMSEIKLVLTEDYSVMQRFPNCGAPPGAVVGHLGGGL